MHVIDLTRLNACFQRIKERQFLCVLRGLGFLHRSEVHDQRLTTQFGKLVR